MIFVGVTPPLPTAPSSSEAVGVGNPQKGGVGLRKNRQIAIGYAAIRVVTRDGTRCCLYMAVDAPVQMSRDFDERSDRIQKRRL